MAQADIMKYKVQLLIEVARSIQLDRYHANSAAARGRQVQRTASRGAVISYKLRMRVENLSLGFLRDLIYG